MLVRDGGNVCLDGRNSERHPYSCFFRKNVYIDKSVAIHGLFTKAHITCDPRYGNLMFRYPEYRLFKLTLSNLVFHNYGVDLIYVSFFNVSISSCRFINSSTVAVGIVQKELRIRTKSSIVVTDSEFLYNKVSVYARLYQGFFTLRISRCVFQGRKGRFNGASGAKHTEAARYTLSTKDTGRTPRYSQTAQLRTVFFETLVTRTIALHYHFGLLASMTLDVY